MFLFPPKKTLYSFGKWWIPQASFYYEVWLGKYYLFHPLYVPFRISHSTRRCAIGSTMDNSLKPHPEQTFTKFLFNELFPFSTDSNLRSTDQRNWQIQRSIRHRKGSQCRLSERRPGRKRWKAFIWFLIFCTLAILFLSKSLLYILAELLSPGWCV